MRFSELQLMLTGFLGVFFLITSCTEKTTELPRNEEVEKVRVCKVVSVDDPVGNNAADFTWNEDGNEVSFSNYTKGKYVLLNFWGTWCGPCTREIPDLIEISKEMKSKGLVVIGAACENTISVDLAFNRVKQFCDTNKVYYLNVITTGPLSDAYGNFQYIPTTFLINNKGEIFETLTGSRTKEEFMEEINKMME